jgi:hypothetical protein
MNQLLRRSGLALALALVALATVGLLRPEAAVAGARHVQSPATSITIPAGSREARGTPGRKPPLTGIEPSYMASSWCGNFWRGPMYCINFNRSEQKWLSGLSLTAATAAICAGTGLGCVVAGSIAYALQRYVDKHGVCPSGDPVLEVEYAPYPGGYIACSDG